MSMPARVYVCDEKEMEKLKSLMEYDPYLDKSKTEAELAALKQDKNANIIFARQDYQIKDGISLGLEKDKYYLYISANEEFLTLAEPKLKSSIESARRADPETEKKIISTIEEEISNSETGIGSIFG